MMLCGMVRDHMRCASAPEHAGDHVSASGRTWPADASPVFLDNAPVAFQHMGCEACKVGDGCPFRDEVKWSGVDPMPKRGARVVTRLGRGTVRAFYVSHGWAGLAVLLDKPPGWYVRQNGRGRLAGIFGAELASPWWVPCARKCKGWLHMDRGIERCDDCARFQDDNQALAAHGRECKGCPSWHGEQVSDGAQ